MSVFRSFSPLAPRSAAQAADVLGRLLEQLPAPRSVAELRLGEGDVEWLRTWGAEMSGETARWSEQRRLLSEPEATRQQAFGLVFLALAAETARREATEGRVWGPVRRRTSTSAASVLFDSQGQPRQGLKDALESACRRWQLRHVFGQEGLQEWYVSVYIQFGLTEQTIGSRLPSRLASAESVPTAVHHLLHDARLRSSTFSSLWNTLVGVRRRNVSDQRARQLLMDSPWALDEWTDELLEAAVSRMDLEPSGRFEEDVTPSLFTAPRLEWAEGKPTFGVELVNLADVAGELPQGAYRCQAGAVTSEFTIDDLGTPHGLQQLRLPLQPAHVTATVERHEGEDSWESVAAEELLLWEPSEEVAVFREDGLALDAWGTALDPSRSYSLVLAPGLVAIPTPDRWARVDGCLAIQIGAGWPPELGVYLGSERIWDPLVAERGPEPLQGWSIPSTGTPLGQAPRIQLYGLSGQLTEVRADRASVAFQQQGSSADVLLAAPEQEVRPSVLIRALDTAGTVRLGRIPIQWFGAQHLRPDGWDSFPVGQIDERDLGQRIRAFTPDEWSEPTLLLGNRPIGRISSRGRARGSITAWGAHLLLADGQFNRHSERELELARSVTVHGLVRDLDDDDAFGGAALVTLRQPVDLHEVTVFGIDRNGVVEDVKPTTTGEQSWILDEPPENALVLAYGDEWIGAWWRRPLLRPQSTEDAVRLLRLLRDSLAPLLSQSYSRWARNALASEPAAALAWLFESSTESSLPVRSPLPDEFAPVARELLDTWEPDKTSVAYTTEALRDPSDQSIAALVDACQRAPVPTARLLGLVFRDRGVGHRVRGALLEGLGWGSGSSTDVLNEIGWQFGVDGGFLERLGGIANDWARGTHFNELQRQNLLVAMNLSGDFRRWLAGRLISEG